LDNIFGPTGTPGSSGCVGMSGTPGYSGTMGYPGVDASTGGLAKDTWRPGTWMVDYAECHEIDELKSDVEIFEEYVKPKKVFKNMPILKELPILRDLPEIRRI